MDYLGKLKFFRKLKQVVPIIVLCSLFFFLLLFSVPAFNPQLFRGYYTLYFRGDFPGQKLGDLISSDPGIDTVISAASAKVSVTNLHETGFINISDLDKRFEPDDPRYDNYMKQLHKYFSVEEDGAVWHIIYIKTSQNALYLSMVMARIFPVEKGEWHIYEQEMSEIVIAVSAVGTVFMLLLLLLFQNNLNRVLLVAGAVPWIYALVSGGIVLFILFFILTLIWALFLKEFMSFIQERYRFKWEEPDSRRLFISFCLYASVIILIIILGVNWKTIIQYIFIAIGIQGLVLAGIFAINKAAAYFGKNKTFGTKYFLPVKIVRIFEPRWYLEKKENILLLSIFIIILVIPVFLLLPGSTPSKNLPVPENAGNVNSGINLSSIEQLENRKTENSLPDLHDFVMHRSYQERLPYGKYEYRFPVPDEEIVMSTYEIDTRGRILKKKKTVTRFDENWFSGVLSRLNPQSVARLLLDQQVPVTVNFRKNRVRDYGLQAVWTIILNWCILLCPLLFLNNRFSRHFIYGVKKDIQILIRELK